MHQNAPQIVKNRHNSTKKLKKRLEMNQRRTKEGQIHSKKQKKNFK